MFNTLKRRLLFLALVTLAAFLWSGMFIFNLFLPKVPWQAQPVSSPVPIKSEQLTINSFKDGALLLSSEPLFSVENYELDRDRRRVIRHYATPLSRLEPLMPRLLNARLAPPDQLISNTQNQFEVFNRYNQPDRLNPTLTSIMHLNNQGKLQLAAQWLGDVHSRVCAPRGECILILTNPFNYDSAAWYSPDGGAEWQPLAEWQFPKSDSEARIDPQKLIAFDDAGKLWAAGNYTLSVSADRGKSWQTMADIRPLLRRNNILATRASEPGVTLYRLHWYLDNHQRLLADITVSLPDGRGDRRFLYQIISDSQERLLATDIHSLAQSPQGEIFLTRPSDRPTRYGLYQLQSDDSLRLVMEHIDRLGEIYAGRTVLALEKGIGDGAHLYLSRDGGQTWRRYQEVQDKPVFAPWRDSFVRLPRYTRLTHYHTAALN